MKKIIRYSTFLLLLTFVVQGQTPTYFNATGGTANAFPLANTGTSRKVQWYIPPNNLGSVGPGNFITDVYFNSSASTTATYPILTIKLKTGTLGGLQGGAGNPVEPGMTVVYSATNAVVTSTAGGWIKFTLQTPWLYDPSQPLIVEMEHNSTTAGGTSLYQTAITGTIVERQWANYNATTLTSSDMTRRINFGIDVIPATPCSSAPVANSISPASFTTCPYLINPALTIANTYSFSGITYQWLSSNTSSLGPYTAITGSTLNFLQTPTVGATTWFQVVATCTNAGGGSTTLTPSHFFVPSTIVSPVPYNEDFEGIAENNRLPNCSWNASNLNGSNLTYTANGTMLRVPHSGSKFASFAATPAGTSYFYSNGISLIPGITYSAGLWYIAETAGYNDWSDLSILINTVQASAGASTIASVSPVSPILYQPLSNTFVVTSPGVYYLAIQATSGSGVSPYLSWDDLSVTVPCSVNGPSITLTPASATVCSGQSVNITATGAESYTWNTGSNSSVLIDTPASSFTYIAVGENTLSGCTSTATQFIHLNPSPQIVVVANSSLVCSGDMVNLSVQGAGQYSYVWGNGSSATSLTVAPSSTTSYSVSAVNGFGCSTLGIITITVNPLPTVAASGSSTLICRNEPLILDGIGALTYKWTADQSAFYYGNPVTVYPQASGTFTMTGTDNNGCSSSFLVIVGVDECTGVDEGSYAGNVLFYPNPTDGLITIEQHIKRSASVQVTDIAGRILMERSTNDIRTVMDISSLPAGVYYITLRRGSEMQTSRIIRR
jgi:hypothetical protein